MPIWDTSNRLGVPSKVFILGEYAVLRSAQALVATLPPRFELSFEPSSEGRLVSEFAEQSPARLLIAREGDQKLLTTRFRDPHEGAGGFGGSTAEFALAYAAIHGAEAPVENLWKCYRELQPRASGADLAAQWVGGVVIADPSSMRVEKADPARSRHLFENFFVFSAAHQSGRKVKTHEHLAELATDQLDRLAESETLSRGLHAARNGDFDSFARAVNEYGDQLREMGLEHPRTTEDRKVLRDVPGVCAVKGAGALQADALIVFGDPELRREDLLLALQSVARSADLRLIASGWPEERGISG